MKKILFLIMFALPFLGYSQNGGQANENPTVKLTYLGYQSGFYTVSLQNKKDCNIDFTVEWLGKDTIINVLSLNTKEVQLPGPAKPMERIRARAGNNCTGLDNGWVEIYTPESLPVKFSSLNVRKIDKDWVEVSFTTYETENVKDFRIQISYDGRIWKNVAIIFPNGYNSNTTYKAKIRMYEIK